MATVNARNLGPDRRPCSHHGDVVVVDYHGVYTPKGGEEETESQAISGRFHVGSEGGLFPASLMVISLA
jgi:hypothetical protein